MNYTPSPCLLYSHTGATEESLGFYSFHLTSNPHHFHVMILLIKDPALQKAWS